MEQQQCTLYRDGELSIGKSSQHKTKICGQKYPSNVLNPYNQTTQEEMKERLTKPVVVTESEFNQCISNGDNQLYSGELIKRDSAKTSQECQQKCETEDDCNYFRYAGPNISNTMSINNEQVKINDCLLWKNKGDVYHREGIQSGRKNCSECLITNNQYPMDQDSLINTILSNLSLIHI